MSDILASLADKMFGWLGGVEIEPARPAHDDAARRAFFAALPFKLARRWPSITGVGEFPPNFWEDARSFYPSDAEWANNVANLRALLHKPPPWQP